MHRKGALLSASRSQVKSDSDSGNLFGDSSTEEDESSEEESEEGESDDKEEGNDEERKAWEGPNSLLSLYYFIF